MNNTKNTPPSSSGGAPSQKELQIFGQQVEKAKQTPYMIVNPSFTPLPPAGANQATKDRWTNNQRAMNAGKFPIRPLPADPYDTTWSLKSDLARDTFDLDGNLIARSMATPSRPLPFTPDDVAYLKRKRDDEEFAGYLKWQADKYDLTDPATRAWFEKRCPSYFQMRESLIEQQIDLAARYAKLRLRGPRTEDDLKLEWFIETDRISLPKGPLWDPYMWIEAEAGTGPDDRPQDQKNAILDYNRRGYRKGLFNPTKVMVPEKGGLMVNPYNLGDIAGYPASNYAGILGANVPTMRNFAAAYGPTAADPSLFGRRDAALDALRNENIARINQNRIVESSKIGKQPPPAAGFAPPPYLAGAIGRGRRDFDNY